MLPRVVAGIMVSMLWCRHVHSQEVRNISLKPELLSYALKNFYVLTVRDARVNTSNIGFALGGGPNGKNQQLNLANGVQESLTRFFNDHLRQDSSTSPMELRVTKFKVEPLGSSGLKAENILTIGLALYQDGVSLIEYTGGGNSKSTGDGTRSIEELIRGTIAIILEQLDNWWANNKSFYTAQKTKESFRVEVSIDEDSEDSNFVAYSLKPALDIRGFPGPTPNQGRCRGSYIQHAVAEICAYPNGEQ